MEENKQKAATKAKSRTRNTKTKSSKAKTTRPKSELLKEPIEESVKEPIEETIKNDVKVAVGAIESKESARIEELKKQIEKLQAEKQSYYEVSGEGESAVVNAERKDASSINRTKIDIEIYNLQNELRDLLTKETKDDGKSKEDPEKDEEKKDDKSKEEPEKGEKNKDDPKKDDKKPEEIDSPEVKAVKDQISSLDNKINSEEWVLRNNEGNYTPEELAQIKAGIDKLKAQRDELNGKLNDLQTGKDIDSKESGEKDDEGQEPSKKNDETKDAEPEKDSPEVKALKDKIKELEGKINAENNALINNGGKYLASDIKEIKERLEKLKGEHAELLGKLSDLEKILKEKDSKGKDDGATKAGEPTKDPSKDDSEGKGKDGKETTEPEMPTYKIGPFKRLLMKIIRKIKSWAKVDGRIARLCDRVEGAVIGNATPLLEGSAEEKEVKKVLEVGKVKDYEKEIADKENAKYSKDKYEKADDHEEAKKKLAQEDMDFLYEKVKEAYELKKARKEIPLIGEIINKEYSKVVDEYADKKSTSFDDKKIDEFSKANDIPEVTKDGAMNLTLWMTSKAIVEMAKEKGIVVNQGKGKNANARPLSEIYASLEARVKTDRVSEEYSKEGRTSFGKDEEKSTVKADKPAKSKTEADSKVDKADDDLDK